MRSFVADPKAPAAFEPHAVAQLARHIRRPIRVVRNDAGLIGVAPASPVGEPDDDNHEQLGVLPPMFPEWLGDRGFQQIHGVRFPYVVGAMANGIASVDLVEAAARAGMLGFFGAAGLPVARVGDALHELQRRLGPSGHQWGSNLIHSPQDPAAEDAVVDLYLKRQVRRVSASAYMDLTPALVRYAVTGLSEGSGGDVLRQNHVFAKISRPEVAKLFMSPAPPVIIERLLKDGAISKSEAACAQRVPLAEDITVESDSGGHTDNRALGALFPVIMGLRAQLEAQHAYRRHLRIGAAGGIGTPAAVASAFGFGAAYVLTGSINQAAVESALAPDSKALLCKAGMADVMMAPAADMFEMGVKVQVLRRGTMFGPRATRLYELYSRYDSLEAIASADRLKLERDILGRSVEDVWADTASYFEQVAPSEIERAQRDPRHRMALVFRWYLGLSSHWAINGEKSRKMDYQIWCGPAMGAFNAWSRGSFLEPAANRGVAQIALNLLEGAAVITRVGQLRCYGAPISPDAFVFQPRKIAS